MIRHVGTACLLLFTLYPLEARELGEPDLSSDRFLASFTASYGVLSEREPPLDDIEIVMLEKIGPLIRIDKKQAQNFLQSMVRSEKDHSASFNYLLGNVYYENEEYLLAEEQYKAAIDAFPAFQRAWTNLGVLKLRAGDTKSALFAFLKAVELGDSKGDTFGMLGFCHYSEGNYISAEVAYNRAVLADPNNLDWLEGKAQTYLKAERFLEAIRMQDELIARRPRHTQYWLAQTNAYLGLEQLDKAARNLEIVRSLGAADFQALYLLGNLYAKQEMYGPSRDAYLEAAKYAKPDDTGFLVRATKILIQSGEETFAKELFGKITLAESTLETNDLLTYKIIASDLALLDNEQENALAFLEDAEEIAPTNGTVLIKMASLHDKMGNRERAYLLLDRAEGDPETEYDALIIRAKLLIDDELFAEAQKYVANALQLDSNEAVRSLLKRVETAASQTSATIE